MHNLPPPEAPAALSLVARERRVQEILGSIENLPSLPSVVLEVMQLAGDQDARASDFEKLIRKDQALAARVLKLVNSPFFGLRSKVSSISQAVVVLGIKSLRSVVIAAKTSRLLDRQLGQYGLDADGMWKHSISCATACRLLAVQARLDADHQEGLFVAGLLHDVGKIILGPHISSFQENFDETLEKYGGDLVRTETELVGMSHAEVGGRMARKWSLDASLEQLIARHHEPADVGEGDRSLHVLRVANDICHQLGIGRTTGAREPSPSLPEWLGALGLAAEDTLDDLHARLEELQGLFQSLASDPDS